ncbi:MAG TPA: bifunctional methylenetetrahydrofolate dehydrogenase/methenyltetrahydrofolate cyclohydrolase, partial [Polyangiales bacterium]|nr:bifunctional methylenetetrahydrofolate dehydrogenase/methenyltetrahydrofolate cyclohydrolase [Polyangiales bacterium]
MAARVIDPAAIAASYRAQLRAELQALPQLTLMGLLAEGHAPSATYAEYTRKGCEDVGMRFQLRSVTPAEAERAVREASADPGVHGILVYYPIGASDGWLRELVDPRKDIEGLHSYWARCLYENRRFVDAAQTKQAILPSTPLAVHKLLEAAGAFGRGARPLEGVKAVVFNRSEVVGYPLAAMMAHDGAQVISFDLEGARMFTSAANGEAHRSEPTPSSRAEALAEADVIVTGVPSRAFPLVRGDEIKPGAICLNF